MTEIEAKAKFFTYDQNNSGGRFDFDEKAGISRFVIVEAPSPRVADALAEDIGLYWGGGGVDCPCCGDRWTSAYAGTDAPTVYDAPISDRAGDFRWMGSRPEGFIHYLDGKREAFWYEDGRVRIETVSETQGKTKEDVELSA